MKLSLAILLILFFQSDISHLKLWDSNSKIEWSDFKGSIPENRGLKKAVTFTKISIKSDFFEGDTPKYIVKSKFDKSKSWTITDSEKHLIHERLHFDITELHSRIIRKKMDSLSKMEEKNIECYKTIYKRILQKHLNAQEEYDRESYSSDTKQQYWINKITKQLEELKEFEYIIKE